MGKGSAVRKGADRVAYRNNTTLWNNMEKSRKVRDEEKRMAQMEKESRSSSNR